MTMPIATATITEEQWTVEYEKVEGLLYELDMADKRDTDWYQWMCDLLDRYDNGERSIELYWEMEDA